MLGNIQEEYTVGNIQEVYTVGNIKVYTVWKYPGRIHNCKYLGSTVYNIGKIGNIKVFTLGNILAENTFGNMKEVKNTVGINLEV